MTYFTCDQKIVLYEEGVACVVLPRKTCGFGKQYAMFGLRVAEFWKYRPFDHTKLIIKFSSSDNVFLAFLVHLILVISR